ncbi:endonuclease/exonuclease/phosphatase [Actinoplanes sp. SE50]|nr:endonuclease/exonuclease/phosphatase [Actinoplanes sp. SE50/110]ATO86742.1 endonuclease/exonuclease/phosphatase [Actinoplanes sp. SE50]SLM04160.1 endonuclease/exonuclease/phosphatase [Actinoplanes sp. SE50/110]
MAAFIVALMVLAFGPPGGRAEAATARSVRVLSFNVCGSYQADCRPLEAADTWADRVAQQVRAWDSDVAVFQEMCAGQRELLAHRLPANYRIAWWTNRSGDNGCDKWLVPGVTADDDFGDAVLVRTDSPATTYSHELTELWDQGRTATAASEEKREVLCMGTVVQGRDSLACTVHLDTVSVDQGMPEAAAQMTSWAAGRPIILAGDFNADPFDPNLGAFYSGGGGTGAFREVDEQDRAYFTDGCRQLAFCRSGETTTFAGTDEAGRPKPARKFDYMFGSAAQVRWVRGDTVDPGFSRRDHKILRGEAVWADDRQPPAVPVVQPAADQLVPDSRSGWSGATDMVTGKFTADAIDDLVVRWYDGAVDLYPGLPGGRLGRPVVVRSTQGSGWSDAAGIAAGDFDGDHLADLAVRWSRNSLFVYYGKDGLRVSTPVLPVWSLNGVTEITAGDVDGDPAKNRDDLIIRRDDGSLAAITITGATAAPARQLMPAGSLTDARHIAFGDAYGPRPGAADHYDDLFVRWNSGSLYAYPGGSSGFQPFAQVQAAAADGRNVVAATALGDFDGDGVDDLVTRGRRQRAAPADDGRLHRYRIGADGTREQPALADAEFGFAGATHLTAGLFTDPEAPAVVARWDTGTVTPAMAPDGGYLRWDDVRDMAPLNLGDRLDDVVIRQGTDAVSVVPVPFRAGQSPAHPGQPVAAPSGGWCDGRGIAELTAGDVLGDGRDDLVLRCADGRVLGCPVLGSPASGDLTAGVPVVIRPAGDTGTVGMYADTIDGHRAVVLRTADGAATARVADDAGGFTTRDGVFPVGAWTGAADMIRDPRGDLLVRWDSGGVRRYPATVPDSGAPAALTVGSFDESGIDHFRYAVDAPADSDAAGWVDVRFGRGVIPLDGLSPGPHTVHVIAVDRAGNRSGELVRPVG